MKKFLLSLLMFLPLVASSQEDVSRGIDTIDGIRYDFCVGNYAKVIFITYGGSVEYSGDITIPESVTYNGENYSVTKIGGEAFKGCGNLTSVSIPNSVTSIGPWAFEDCSSLTSITIPNSVTSIPEKAFWGCTSLASVSIPNSVTSIGVGAFNGCSSLASITIPASVTDIGEGAFDGSGLTSITIPNGVSLIKESTFSGCSNLTSVTIPSSVTSIEMHAFSSCSSLSSITIPNSVTSIGSYAFASSGLSSITIPTGVTTISDHTFSGCESLTSVTIPNSVTSIEKYAFFCCSNLTSITIPNGVTSIGKSAFSGCGLQSVTSLAVKPPLLGNLAFSNYDIPLYVPYASQGEYQVTDGWKSFHPIIVFDAPAEKYILTYEVDGEEYKSYELTEGDAITPEAAPTKEGYTFSGWSDIPATMPDNDVTVTGTFTINKYKLIYKVDVAEYKKYEVEYGATITPEAAPTKEGYTFSGWSDIPSKMPAKDVTVTGTFTINKYKLIYKVDGSEYKKYEVEYGAAITPEAAPTKDGYTFSGWSDIPSRMPAKDVTVTGSFTINKYKLIYKVDGEEYKKYELEYGAKITPEPAPTKEGYSFSGWSSIPETMPAKDVTITGTFSKGAYKLTYMVDGAVYKTVSYDYGDAITPEAAPTKEGYTFSGWSDIPKTMPAEDVTVKGSFTINKYKLVYMVDGAEYKKYEIEYGAKITPEAAPTKDGYSFSGWSTIPETMPAKDVTVTGTFTKNEEQPDDPQPDDPQTEITKEDVVYEIEGGTVTVTQSDNATGAVKIEASVEISGKTYEVTVIAKEAFKESTGMTAVDIPNSITSIGEKAFEGCTGLRLIEIGKGIKEIASKAFANIFKSNARTRGGDDGLQVYCEADAVPNTASDAFDGTDISHATLHVPESLIDTYKVTAPWKGFGTIVGLSTGIKTISIDQSDVLIFDMQGNRLNNLRKGLNIIRTKDGKTKKIVVK